MNMKERMKRKQSCDRVELGGTYFTAVLQL